MGGYSKLFSSIIHSTVWREPDHIRLVWITMLAMMDDNGFVDASIPGLADAARVNINQCVEALNRLSSPDPYNNTAEENEGRRILDIPRGWEILNYEIYRSGDEYRSGYINQKIKDMVFRRDEGACQICGSSDNIEYDHIIPVSKGGSNELGNIQLLCRSCNRMKGSKIV